MAKSLSPVVTICTKKNAKNSSIILRKLNIKKGYVMNILLNLKINYP
jgi:hypothetical protein